MKAEECVFQDGSYPCGNEINPDCYLCHKVYQASIKEVVELQFMPRARKWRVLIDGKAFPRRFSDRASAIKEYERQKSLALEP